MVKTTESRYKDGSVQARQIYKDYTSNPIPISLSFLIYGTMLILKHSLLNDVRYEKDVGMGLLV